MKERETIGLFFIILPTSILHIGGFSDLANHVHTGFTNLTNIGGKAIFSYFLLYFFGMMIGQDVWQRAFTSKNKSVLKKERFQQEYTVSSMVLLAPQ